MAKEKDFTALLTLAKKRFKQADEAESTNRARSLEDERFVNLDDQWTAEELTERTGRPCIVINKCNTNNKQIKNDARQNKPRIKVRPADSKADPKVAEIFNGIIRSIENASDADAAYDNGIDNAVDGGWGYWRVVTEYCDDDVFEQDIRIKRIVNRFSVYMDPNAREADRSDAKWCFITEVISQDEFKEQFPDIDVTDWEQGQGESNAGWIDKQTVRIAEYYYLEPINRTLWQIVTKTEQGESYDTIDAEGQELIPEDDLLSLGITDGKKYLMLEGDIPALVQAERTVKTNKVMWCKITGNKVIEGPIEQAGRYIPVVTCTGDEVWIEGEPVRKSAHYHAKGAQKLYNWARSNAVETLALSPKQPFIGTEAMFEGYEGEWDRAATTPKMRLMANFDNGQLPQRQPISISDNGALQEAMQAADDIKATTGIYDAALGKQSNETSGRAIIARQRESDTSTFHFPDNQARAIRFTGRILVDLIPKIYDTQRVVRLLNQDGSEGWAEVNKRVPDPTAKDGYKTITDLSVGKYDVTCDVGPGYMTKRLEAADGMVQFLSAAPATAPVLLPRIAKNADWPEADEIAEELAQIMNPQAQQPDPAIAQQQQAQMQAEQQKMQFDMQSKQMDLQGKQTAAEAQAMTAQIDLQKAQIELEGKKIDLRSKEIEHAMKMHEMVSRETEIEEVE